MLDPSVLPGTQRRRAPHCEILQRPGHPGRLEVGLLPRRGGAGIAVLLGLHFSEQNVIAVWIASLALLGQGLAFRLLPGRFDIAGIAFYFPPQPHISSEQPMLSWTVQQLMGWMMKIMSDLEDRMKSKYKNDTETFPSDSTWDHLRDAEQVGRDLFSLTSNTTEEKRTLSSQRPGWSSYDIVQGPEALMSPLLTNSSH